MIAKIGSLLKKTYRQYTRDVLSVLEGQGFSEWRVSYIDIFFYLMETDRPTGRELRQFLQLSKQTVSNHLAVLEGQGFIRRTPCPLDRREQIIELTSAGKHFQLALLSAVREVEARYQHILGDVELERLCRSLELMQTLTSQQSKDLNFLDILIRN